ncbi:MAG: hypothetical protein R3E12_07345 [Candidatus Eisenbacteria bacterium]
MIRFADLLRTGALLHLRFDERATWFFLLEITVGFVIPIIYFASPAVLHNRRTLYRAAQLCLLGFIINRLNVSVTGFEVVSGHTYVPAWTEVAVTITIITAGVWAVYFAERYLPVLEAHPAEPEWRWKGNLRRSSLGGVRDPTGGSVRGVPCPVTETTRHRRVPGPAARMRQPLLPNRRTRETSADRRRRRMPFGMLRPRNPPTKVARSP